MSEKTVRQAAEALLAFEDEDGDSIEEIALSAGHNNVIVQLFDELRLALARESELGDKT